MTLLEFLSQPLPDIDTLRTLAVVFDTAMAQRMVNAHAWYGDPRCTVYPAPLADGRWCHIASILPDCVSPDGGYHAGFSRLNAANFASVEVVPLADLEFASEAVPQLVPEPQPEESPSPVS
jgi:hypothetical protein